MSILLDLDEDVLCFERPLTRTVQIDVKITNPHPQPVTFKVKTTAPKLYCVRPNSSIIPSHESITIQIVHQGFREEPPLNAKCRDRFLIMSAFYTNVADNVNLQDLWSQIEANEKDTINNRKLRCEYVQSAPQNTPNLPVEESKLPIETPIQAINTKEISEKEPATITTSINDILNEKDNEQSDEAHEKLRKMEEELNKYKKEVESLREAEPVVIEKVKVKTTGYPLSVLIFISLLIASIAYFIKSKE
ncbi:MAG: vesicle-associated membrane protein-associated protein A [Benjaminiella poitrasii]|nr:MAG: vesicle-associated membrane protein-associated protein A [Benjaminiella poitrasii]